MHLFRSLVILFLVSACSTVTQNWTPPDKNNVVYVVGRGWHTDIGIPVQELDKNLAFYAKIFPGAKTIMFGYGKKTFVTAPPDTIGEYFLGPVPGPAIIHVVGINVLPTEAYPPEDTYTLALPLEGKKALSAYIWNDLAKDEQGKLKFIGNSHAPQGLFYAANSEYNLLHTCNTWAVDALQAANLPISGDGVIVSGQSMARVSDLAESQSQFNVR